MTLYRRRLPHFHMAAPRQSADGHLPLWIEEPSTTTQCPRARANAILTLTGTTSCAASAGVEGNPVRAGLVVEASDYRWSSAGWATGGSPADRGVRPTSPHQAREVKACDL